MTGLRLIDYIDHIESGVSQVTLYIEGLCKDDFVADTRTQQAVIFNIIIVGEAATRLTTTFPDFAARFPEVPWASMRGMRNRMAHGYFEINLDVVWETARTAMPALQRHLPGLRRAAASEADSVVAVTETE